MLSAAVPLTTAALPIEFAPSKNVTVPPSPPETVAVSVSVVVVFEGLVDVLRFTLAAGTLSLNTTLSRVEAAGTVWKAPAVAGKLLYESAVAAA